ncbi:VanW family protein [Actinomadura sp. WMMB 499]|uniref:VanW family protein n=1 Tax=Actinomadura sp. WMMB 499 TaxID=1219491 RepID=UPI001248450C|nr:VanW family protein [Actinomadura sp. WMMB 499]QFG24005.1 VanW family protein [Actinomadura sp. WMMB 499]
MGRTRRRHFRRYRADQRALRDHVRRWWPFVVGVLVANGFLLATYLWAPREPAATAVSAPDPAARRTAPAERPMSTFTTRFDRGEPRVRNIGIAARLLDGAVVRPGATFSFNEVVGPRTEDRGYVPAPVIMGPRLVNDIGGGICQVSSTLYNAVFRAGLDIERARAHTMWMPEYPDGREAAVAYPDLDFRWRNDTTAPVRIEVERTDSSITVSLWGERRYEVRSETSERYDRTPYGRAVGRGSRCVPTTGREGFEIDVWRVLLEDGRKVRREKYHTEYQPQPEVTCV